MTGTMQRRAALAVIAVSGLALAMPLVPIAASGSSPADRRLLRPLFTLREANVVTALAWSTDGNRLATASDFGRDLTVWDAHGDRIAQFRRDFSYVFNSLAFVGEERLLAPIAAESPGEASTALSVIDLRTRRVAVDVSGPAPGEPV